MHALVKIVEMYARDMLAEISTIAYQLFYSRLHNVGMGYVLQLSQLVFDLRPASS